MDFTPQLYDPSLFRDVQDMEQAARVILTPEGDKTTPQRWDTETPYLIDLLSSNVELKPESWVLDYGTGIGRLARGIIEKHKCNVVGVDISNSMRSFAVSYVDSEKFIACSPEMLDRLVGRWNVRFDLAISVWVLQHCEHPGSDVARIQLALRRDAKLFVVEQKERSLPTSKRTFINDGVDVRDLLSIVMSVDKIGALDKTIIPEGLAQRSYWATFRNRVPVMAKL